MNGCLPLAVAVFVVCCFLFGDCCWLSMLLLVGCCFFFLICQFVLKQRSIFFGDTWFQFEILKCFFVGIQGVQFCCLESSHWNAC